jgi:hypothetical protein
MDSPIPEYQWPWDGLEDDAFGIPEVCVVIVYRQKPSLAARRERMGWMTVKLSPSLRLERLLAL